MKLNVMFKSLKLCMVILFTILTPSNCNVALNDLFVFGEENGDVNLRPDNLDDGSSERLDLSTPFPFFDHLHNFLWININGGISLVNAISSFTPVCTPVPQNYRMIAPYWCDLDLRLGGEIFYRESLSQNDLSKAQSEIISAFPEFENLKLKWSFIVTWHDVTFYGSGSCSTRLPATFQSILASDGVYGFTLFYYNSITFISGTSSNGNCSGIGDSPARAGFDAGDGDEKTIFTIEGSCTPNVITIDERSNVNSPGKWVFRVDDRKILPAGCDISFTGNLRLVSNYIDMFGHVPIKLIGPCFDDSYQAICRFHDPVKGMVDVLGQRVSNLREVYVICVAPFIYSSNRINVDLVLSNDENVLKYPGFLYTLHPRYSYERLVVTINPTSISGSVNATFEWNQIDFPEVVDFNLYVYSRDFPQWTLIGTLEANIPNTGSFSNTYTTDSLPTQYIHNSVFTISVEPNQEFKKSKAITVKTARFSSIDTYYKLLKALRLNLKDDCIQWIYSAPPAPTDVISCPPTVRQAEEDTRFTLEPSCFTTPCDYNPAVDFCLVTVNPSPSGGGQQCCYKDGNIFTGIYGGGSVDRCHYTNWLCHETDDILGWVHCCSEGNQELCSKYYGKRPSNDGSGYTPDPGSGGAGDPHLTTFDRLEYTFNGAGEFWLIKNSSVMPIGVQARMEPFLSSNGIKMNATVFTAFVMKANNSSTVELKLSEVRKVDIYVDGVVMDLSNQLLYDMSYLNVEVLVAYDLSTVLVSFDCGFSFKFTISADALTIVAFGDNIYKHKTSGLLGVLDGVKENDLQDPEGNIIPIDSTLDVIHYSFGLKWRVLETESLFTYTDKQYSDYNDPNFVPNFEQPDIGSASQEAIDLCGDSSICLYDYMTSGSPTLANQTKVFAEKLNETMEILEEIIIFCPSLVFPENGYYITNNFLPGSAAKFVCNSNYTLDGNEIIYCDNSGSWNGTIPLCVAVSTEQPVTTVSAFQSTTSSTYTINNTITNTNTTIDTSTTTTTSSVQNPITTVTTTIITINTIERRIIYITKEDSTKKEPKPKELPTTEQPATDLPVTTVSALQSTTSSTYTSNNTITDTNTTIDTTTTTTTNSVQNTNLTINSTIITINTTERRVIVSTTPITKTVK